MTVLSEIILPAKIEHLPAFIASATGAAEEAGLNQKKLFDVELALEEALVNIINYAYSGDRPGTIKVTCKKDDGPWFIVDVIDSGVAFNILSVAEPDLSADVSERRIGGLGIHFMKKVMDSLEYRREGSENVLEMKMRLSS